MSSHNIYQSTVTCVRATDLIKIANQLYNDKMEYVRLSINSSRNEDLDGSIQIHAIPSATSEDVKEYPLIKSNSIVDFDDLVE